MNRYYVFMTNENREICGEAHTRKELLNYIAQHETENFKIINKKTKKHKSKICQLCKCIITTLNTI